jgi:hypothetical protein
MCKDDRKQRCSGDEWKIQAPMPVTQWERNISFNIAWPDGKHGILCVFFWEEVAGIDTSSYIKSGDEG